MNKILISLAAAATIVTASPALASDPAARPVTINLAGLDLSRAADVRKLDHRIAVATETACGTYEQVRGAEEAQITRCRADVARQIAPQLAAVRAKAHLAAR